MMLPLPPHGPYLVAMSWTMRRVGRGKRRRGRKGKQYTLKARKTGRSAVPTC